VRLDVELDRHGVANDDLAPLGRVLANVEVRAPDRRTRREADPGLALQARRVEPEELRAPVSAEVTAMDCS
jgi:hypothetical protein